MREYELTFIVQPEISDEGLQELFDRFDALLESGRSIRLCYDDWGRRRLAYDIANFQKGRYVVLYFLSDGSVVPELERICRLEDSILRFLAVLANPEVSDVEARRTEAAAFEQERKRKAEERAAREAEEAAARAAEAEAAAARAEREEREDRGDGGEEASEGGEAASEASA